MRRTRRTGNFLICLLFNMLLNIDGLIPAVVLLVLHFLFKISVWWSVAAAVIWIVCLSVWMFIIGWARDCSSEPDAPKENKNPYSAKNIYR